MTSLKNTKMNVKVQGFSQNNNYFIIGNKSVYTCLVPVKETEKYRKIFEECKTMNEVFNTILKYNLVH